jgi:hypothetical protein
MAKFEELHSLVSAYAPNVPNFVAGNAIREAARRFFRATRAYTVQVDVPFLAGLAIGEIDLFNDSIEVISTLSVTTLKKVEQTSDSIATGTPRHFTGEDKLNIRVYPIPDQDIMLTAIVAVRPTFKATELDDAIVSENEEALRYGALEILKAQVATEWHSPEEIQYYGNLFTQQINQKRIDIHKRYIESPLTVKLQRYL